ncbi:hypothetical protein [Solibacillus palustris]|nr:hypothetical protein [Solibacillus sp. MA9]
MTLDQTTKWKIIAWVLIAPIGVNTPIQFITRSYLIIRFNSSL